MTVTEKLAHAAERKAFETMLDSLIRKSRTQDVGKVADDLVRMVQKIHSSVWEPETFAAYCKRFALPEKTARARLPPSFSTHWASTRRSS